MPDDLTVAFSPPSKSVDVIESKLPVTSSNNWLPFNTKQGVLSSP